MNEEWTKDDVQRWLTDYPLPPDFVWRGKKVEPSHRTLKGGFGKWLRETPYHQGLFEEICQLIRNMRPGQAMPSPRELARLLTDRPQPAQLPIADAGESPFG